MNSVHLARRMRNSFLGGSYSVKKNRFHLLEQKREFWPLLAAGAAAAVFAHYAIRAYENQDKIQEESVPEVNVSRNRSYFGIDIGSSSSRVSICELDKKSPYVVENREGRRSTPSVVFFDYGMHHAWKSVTDANKSNLYVGSSASRYRILKPEQTFTGSSLLKGSVFPVSTAPLTSAEKSFIYYLLAEDLKITAQSKTERADSIPSHVSVPNAFTAAQSSLVVSSCRDAGFNCVASIPDAVAAVLGMIESDLYRPPYDIDSMRHNSVYVIDIGGSIVQMSVLLVKSVSNCIPVILTQKTIENKGGNSYDEAIANYLLAEFSKENPGICLRNDSTAMTRIYDAAEAAKIELSGASTSKVYIPYITANHSRPMHLEVEISKTQLNIILEQLIADITQSFKEVLADAKNQLSFPCSSELESEPVDLNLTAVLLVGGGARMPLIRSVIQEAAGSVPVLVSPQPEETTVIGVSAYSRMLNQF